MADAAGIEAVPDRKRVLVTCCNGTGWIHKLVAFKLMELQRDGRYNVTVMLPTHRPYVNNLHLVVRDMLAGGYDYWLSIDDDNPPQANPLDLVELDLDIVGCPTPVWYCDTKNAPNDRPYYYNALRAVGDGRGGVGFKPLDAEKGFRPVGLQRADAVGTGCILIARRVLEELVKRAKESGDPRNAPFMRTWTPDGVVVMGNDYAFCTRATTAGFEVWAHFDYTCEHVNELPLVETINALMRFRMGD